MFSNGVRMLKSALVIGCITAIVSSLATCSAPESRPNIILILADDLGVGDVTAYNPASLVSTRNIDAIAKAGVIFMDAHSASALCAPTRYSLMSGNYPWRGSHPWGAWTYTGGSAFKPGQISLAQLMRSNGYQTAMFGKVHLGARPVYKMGVSGASAGETSFLDIEIEEALVGGPKDLGFDYSYTAQSGIQGPPFAFFENDRLTVAETGLSHLDPGEYQTDSGISVIPETKTYAPKGWWGANDWRSHEFEGRLLSGLLDYLEEWSGSSERSPFFVYYAPSAVHAPHSPPDEFLGKFVRGQTPTRHLDMVLHLDLIVGEILAYLREHDLIDNTVLIFTSDNGGLNDSMIAGHRSSGAFRGFKGTAWEGGHRVPLLMSWPDGNIPASGTVETLTGLQDVFMTLSEVIGANLPLAQASDSVSFLGELTGATAPHRKEMMFQAGKKEARLAFRSGELKLITDLNMEPVELYDLRVDLSEQNNLAADPEFKDVVNALLERFKAVYPEKRLR